MSLLNESGALSFLVRRTWLAMRSVIDDELKAFGLSTSQYATLMILNGVPGRSNSDVARAVGTTRQAANEMLANLERDGLIERRAHPQDRRAHQLFLTPAGRKRHGEARVAVAKRESELEQGFSAADRKAVREWLDGIAGACLGPDDDY